MIYYQSRYTKNDTQSKRSIRLGFLNVNLSNNMNNDNKAVQKRCAYIKYMYIFILWLYWIFFYIYTILLISNKLILLLVEKLYKS